MITKGIRGAITVTENTESAIKDATIELLDAICKKIILMLPRSFLMLFLQPQKI